VDGRLFLVDLPGYGFAKVPFEVRKHWEGMIDGFFDSDLDLRLVILAVDARHEPSPLDRSLLQWLRSKGTFCQVVATKFDKLSRSEGQRALGKIREALELEELIPFSATRGDGKKQLWQVIQHLV